MNQVPGDKNVVFYDGVCCLCNGFVKFILQLDRRNSFIFIPLQSSFAKEKLSENHIAADRLQSIYVLPRNNAKLLSKSSAVLFVLSDIGGIWSLFNVLRIFPAALLNVFYDLVAENRYKWFGKADTCLLPDHKYKDKFLYLDNG